MQKGNLRSRVRSLAVVIVAAFLFAAVDGGLARPSVAQAETASEIAVGQQLEALTDVTLARAEISKGSKVNVTRIVARKGQASSVDVELADGAIAHVAIAVVRASFRVISE